MLAENYMMLKHLHMMFAVISIFLFVLRFVMQQMKMPLAGAKPLKVLPHINDSLLLASAIMLTLAIQQYPLVHAWLTEKVVLLVIYIIFGMFALKWGKTNTIKRICFVAAVATFGTILMIARTKTPLLFG